jgi:hypothetical protein
MNNNLKIVFFILISLLVGFSIKLYREMRKTTPLFPCASFTQKSIAFPFDADLQNMIDHPEEYTLQEALAIIALLKGWTFKVMRNHLNLDEDNMRYFTSIMENSQILMEVVIPSYENHDEL